MHCGNCKERSGCCDGELAVTYSDLEGCKPYLQVVLRVGRATLDTSIKIGIDHGGYIPKGRKTEDGVLPEKYQLEEMPTASYPKRTEKNTLDSDGTLILSCGKLTGGLALTRKLAKKHEKPWVHVDLDKLSLLDAVKIIKAWIDRHDIEILNVAGPRASKSPSIYAETVNILERVMK